MNRRRQNGGRQSSRRRSQARRPGPHFSRFISHVTSSNEQQLRAPAANGPDIFPAPGSQPGPCGDGAARSFFLPAPQRPGRLAGESWPPMQSGSTVGVQLQIFNGGAICGHLPTSQPAYLDGRIQRRRTAKKMPDTMKTMPAPWNHFNCSPRKTMAMAPPNSGMR